MPDSKNAPGVKFDKDKPRVELVFDSMSRALLEVARVATHGAEKYTEDGWVTVPDGERRYRAAGDRHRLQSALSLRDEESGMLHKAHQAWNVLAELELYLRRREIEEGNTNG